mmetsp:Transcript_9708/g.23072  ORF Transcript_9708/g.23072 Transcript_9708/m.23072 type:complete len:206 (+) Transcript_9708:450-1067(+)
MHCRLSDVLHNHWNAELPEEHLFIIRGCQKTFPIFADRHGVDGTHVLIILLGDGASVGVPLHRLLVGATRHDDILLRLIRMHRHAKGRLLVREGGNNFACLGIPVLDVLVVGHAIEAAPIGSEGNVADRLIVAKVGPKTLALVVVVPDHDLAIHARREQQVGSLRKPLDLRHPHGVPCPSVDPLLWQKALLVVHVFGDVGLVVDP